MTVSNELLKKKAFGIIQSIEKMSPQERGTLPSGIYGDDYNRLWDLVSKANPELAPLLPPRVDVFTSATERLTTQNYSEILTFCSQMYQLLS